MAKSWMDALRAKDREQLQKLAALPFKLSEPAEYPKCDPVESATREDVPNTLACLLDDKLFMEELSAQPEPVTEVISGSTLPAWAASVEPELARGTLVLVRLPGNGVSYQLLVLLTTAGVSGVWKLAKYDPN